MEITSTELTYLADKSKGITKLLEHNRSYQQRLLELKRKLTEERDQYAAMIKQFKEERKIKRAKRYFDSTPYIEFYKYEKPNSNISKPKSLCLLRLLSGKTKSNSKYNKLQDLISVSSETSMESEDSEEEVSNTYVSSKNNMSNINKSGKDDQDLNKYRFDTFEYENMYESSDDYENFDDESQNITEAANDRHSPIESSRDISEFNKNSITDNDLKANASMQEETDLKIVQGNYELSGNSQHSLSDQFNINKNTCDFKSTIDAPRNVSTVNKNSNQKISIPYTIAGGISVGFEISSTRDNSCFLQSLNRKSPLTPKQDKNSILTNTINNIIKSNHIKVENVKIIDFVKLAKKSNSQSLLKKTEMPVVGIDIYKQFRKIYNLDGKIKVWTESDDKKLKKAVDIHGIDNFAYISQRVEGKHAMDCYHRWFKSINMHRKIEKWSPSEDFKLGLAVLCFESGNISENASCKIRWIDVSKVFEVIPGVMSRTDVQVRERFMNILKPTISHNNFSKEQSDMIMKYYEKYGTQWSKIGRELSYLNKTDAQVKREVCTRLKFKRKIQAQKDKTEREIELKIQKKRLQLERKQNLEQIDESDKETECINEMKKLNLIRKKIYKKKEGPRLFSTPQV